MIQLLGISGSLRTGSFNTALLNAAVELVGDGVTLLPATLHGIPLYDADAETRDGLPDAVVALKARITQCDGLLLVTPEYNASIPGVFKNAIDWLSRPASDIPRVFGDKPVAVIGASPGGFGTLLSQNTWLPVLRALKARPWHGASLMAARAHTLMDDSGRLVDEATRERLRSLLAAYVEFVQQSGGASR